VEVNGRKFTGFARVRRFGRAMPDVEEGTAWGVPALRADGKIICCTAGHRDAEPNTLVVMVPFEQRNALIEEEPDIYYLKPHYVGHPCVLVRLPAIPDDALRDLLLTAKRFLSESGKRKPSKPSTRRRSARRAP
jgi:hypothetical protein